MNVLEGIDVSKWQNKIDWQTVANLKRFSFACAQATNIDSKGNYVVDPQFKNNWNGIKSNGLIRGAYAFGKSQYDPIKQADFFVDTLGPLDPEDFLMLDIEVPGLSGKQFTDWILTWLEHVENRTGKIPFVYSYGPFFITTAGKVDSITAAKLQKYPFWLAAYVKDPNKYVPQVWKNKGWVLWQRSGDIAAPGETVLRIPGISANVDLNNFNGTIEEFKEILLNLHTGKESAIKYAFNIDTSDSEPNV